MAKYTIEHSCGHTVAHQIYGPVKGRDKQAERLGLQLCEACYRAKRDTDLADAGRQAGESAATLGLVALKGSPKQIAWAETLRLPVAKLLGETRDMLVASLKPEVPASLRQQIEAAISMLIAEVLGQDSAKWWIDGRGKLPIAADNWREAAEWIEEQIEERGLVMVES